MYKEQTHFSTDTYKPHQSSWIIQFSFGQGRTEYLSLFSHISCLLMKAKIGKRDYIDRGCIAKFSVSRHVGRAQDTDSYAAFVLQSTRLDGRG